MIFFCLEASGSATARTGWQPQHLVAETDDGAVLGVGALLSEIPLARRIRVRSPAGPRPTSAPAAATIRSSRSRCRSRRRPAGGCWSPVRQTPTGCAQASRRPDRTLPAARGVLGACHLPPETEWRLLGEHGYLQRTDQQFHWENARLRDLRRFPRGARGAQAQDHPARAARARWHPASGALAHRQRT